MSPPTTNDQEISGLLREDFINEKNFLVDITSIQLMIRQLVGYEKNLLILRKIYSYYKYN